MSHITECEIQVSDIPAFDKACQDRGCELRRDQKTFKNYGGRRSPCDMAIVVLNDKKAYEAGLIKQPDGKYKIQVDNFDAYEGGGMVKAIGQDAGLLLQRYGINAAKSAAVKQGMQVREQVQADGSIKLTCEAKQFAFAQSGPGWGSGF